MLPESTLFDPAPYTTGTPRQPRQPRPVPDAVRVNESGWHLIARNGHPPLKLAHRVIDTNNFGSVTTACRMVARSVASIEIGTSARLCSKCGEVADSAA